MFKNKWILVAFAMLLVGTLVYSLRTGLPFKEEVEKSREDYKQSMLTMEDSPIDLNKFEYFSYFDPNEAMVFECEFIESENKDNFSVMMTDSSSAEFPIAGIAKLKIDDKIVELKVFDEGETLLLPFNDLTNGKETYGGGRYINIEKKVANKNKITLDFNSAHNFYCAYNNEYICPIPPKNNFIKIAINAGEKTYHSH